MRPITRSPIRSVLAAALAVACLLAGASSASAHGGADAWIHVPGEGMQPGRDFELWGADFAPDSSIQITVVAGSRTINLGRATAEADGHFTVTLTAPSDTPAGYAQLMAVASDGSQASTWVAVGGVADGGQSAARSSGNWWADPVVALLAVGLAAGLVLLAWIGLSRRRTQPNRT